MPDPTNSWCDFCAVWQTQITYGYYDMLEVPQLRLTESSVRRQEDDVSDTKPARKGVAPDGTGVLWADLGPKESVNSKQTKHSGMQGMI